LAFDGFRSYRFYTNWEPAHYWLSDLVSRFPLLEFKLWYFVDMAFVGMARGLSEKDVSQEEYSYDFEEPIPDEVSRLYDEMKKVPRPPPH